MMVSEQEILLFRVDRLVVMASVLSLFVGLMVLRKVFTDGEIRVSSNLTQRSELYSFNVNLVIRSRINWVC